MPPWRNYCDLSDLLPIKENKINKLKQVINDRPWWLMLSSTIPPPRGWNQNDHSQEDDSRFTDWGQTTNTTNRTRVRGMLPPRIEKRKRCTKTKFSQKLLQRDSYPAHHLPGAPNGDGYKDREQMRVPDSHPHQSLSLLNSLVNYQANFYWS